MTDQPNPAVEHVIEAVPFRTLSVLGEARRFPVNRVFCVGRNYAAHAREMGGDDRDPPFFFMKAASAAVDAGIGEIHIPYPPMTSNYHHEVELVVAIARGGSNVTTDEAAALIYGYAVGFDMTRRDLQFAARDKGRPWEFGKSFSNAAPIGAIAPVAMSGHPKSAAIWMSVNGATRQSGNIDDMIWSAPECIAYLSRYEALQPGDLIMTGTPEGVSPVVAGDLMHGHVDGLADITVRIGS